MGARLVGTAGVATDASAEAAVSATAAFTLRAAASAVGARAAAGAGTEVNAGNAEDAAVGCAEGEAAGVGCAEGEAVAVGCAEGEAVAVGSAEGATVAVGRAEGEVAAVGRGDGEAAGVMNGVGRGVRGGSIVAIANGPRTPRDGSAVGPLVATPTRGARGESRCMYTAMRAPIPRPATTTPKNMASVGSQPRIVGHQPPDLDGARRVSVRRRRGGVDIAARLPRAWQEASHAGAKRRRMIRVSVPIDLNAVVSNACAAFALATPLRVRDVVTSAVVASLGSRAPQDKRERAIRRTLDGFRAGDFLVEIDGRAYTDTEDVIVCTGVITLRFFARRTYRRAA